MKYNKGIKTICYLLIACLLLQGLFLNSGVVSAKSKTSIQTKKLTVYVNKSKTIKLKNVKKKNTYTYKSSNKKVAVVTKKGKVTGKKVGKSYITVKETYKSNGKCKTRTLGKVKVTVKKKTSDTIDTSSAQYKSMISNSLISTGNNQRMKNAIEKAQRGEQVTIAYIGGSITEGYNSTANDKCYAYLSYLYFKKTYGTGDGSNVKFINAGMSGTPSTVGMVRYERDVKNADIVFVEFAVNDYDDMTNGDAYESLALNILKQNNNPAVVLLFSVFANKQNLQDRLIPVGQYYDLPMISIKNAVVPALNSGFIKSSQYFSDQFHPTDAGHVIMSDCIANYYKAVDAETKKTTDITIPATPKIGNSYVGIKMIDSANVPAGVTIDKGGFTDVEKNLKLFSYDSTRSTFPNNWKCPYTKGTATFDMKLNCKNLVMIFKQSSAKMAGAVDVYIDGVKTQTVDSYKFSGWNNPYPCVLINDTTAKDHDVKLVLQKDANGEEQDFAILAFGYTQ